MMHHPEKRWTVLARKSEGGFPRKGKFYVEGPVPHDIEAPLHSRSDLKGQEPKTDAPLFSITRPS